MNYSTFVLPVKKTSNVLFGPRHPPHGSGDDSTYFFRLQRFTSVPGISARSMRLDIPENLQELSVDQFLELLVAAE